MSSAIPSISVVMAVRNGEAYLPEAMESILSQSIQDFEFIIINDGSTDRTGDILQTYQQADSRIEIVSHEIGKGLAASLNRGLALARGQYIARMDADDISLPERFAKQLRFMDEHPEVGVCGTWIKTIGEQENLINRYPSDEKAIQCWLLFGSGLCHPSVMLRRSLLAQANLTYDVSFQYNQDHDFWVRCSSFCQLANLPEVLMLYRTHAQQMTQTYQQGLRLSENQRIWDRLWQRLNLEVSPQEPAIHQAIYLRDFQCDRAFIQACEAWLYKISQANEVQRIYAEPNLSQVLAWYWFAACYQATGLGLWTWRRFWQSPLAQYAALNVREKAQFFLRCCFPGIKYYHSS